MSIRDRMTKILEGLPTYGTKPAQKGDSKGGPESAADRADRLINGVGWPANEIQVRAPAAIPTAKNKGPGKPEPETGKGKKGVGKGVGLKGRMESLLATIGVAVTD